MNTDSKIADILYLWERRRLTYNAVLLVLGVALVAYAYPGLRLNLSVVEITLGCAGVAAAANLAYFAGPVAEVYSLIFLRREWLPPLRNFIFIAGLGFSALVLIGGMFASLIAIGLANQ